jgi:hypothetical protein
VLGKGRFKRKQPAWSVLRELAEIFVRWPQDLASAVLRHLLFLNPARLALRVRTVAPLPCLPTLLQSEGPYISLSVELCKLRDTRKVFYHTKISFSCSCGVNWS